MKTAFEVGKLLSALEIALVVIAIYLLIREFKQRKKQ